MSHLLLQSDPQIFRENIAQYFIKLFDNSDKIGRNIETGVFNFTLHESSMRQIIKKWKNPQFCEIYLSRLKTIITNLEQNKDLKDTVQNETITAKSFAFISHQEMKPERWRKMMDKKSKRDQSRFSNHLEASTDMFTCKKCKSKRCTYYELQTRSADEPATIFVTCLDCGKNWKNS
jgi:DNA-directed RNA polymerase subunit M/transcription elongation factor TFIIS